MKGKADAIAAFMFELNELTAISEFDEKLWTVSIEMVRVYSDGRLVYVFHNGREIEVK